MTTFQLVHSTKNIAHGQRHSPDALFAEEILDMSFQGLPVEVLSQIVEAFFYSQDAYDSDSEFDFKVCPLVNLESADADHISNLIFNGS